MEHTFDADSDRCSCGAEEVHFDGQGYGCANNGPWDATLRRVLGPNLGREMRRVMDRFNMTDRLAAADMLMCELEEEGRL